MIRLLIITLLISATASAQFGWKSDTLYYADGTGDTVRIFVKNKQIPPIIDATSAGLQALGSNIIAQTAGQPLPYCNTSSNLADAQISLSLLEIKQTTTVTGVSVYMRTAGNYTGDQNNRVGLYSLNVSTGTLTLVASSANSSTLWTASANARLNIPFSEAYSNAAPGWYAVAILYNNSAQTTAPAVASGVALNNAAMAGTAFGFSNSIKLYGTVGSQTNLPSTIAMSSVTAATAPRWMAIY